MYKKRVYPFNYRQITRISEKDTPQEYTQIELICSMFVRKSDYLALQIYDIFLEWQIRG